MAFKYPLNSDFFTVKDRLRLAKFALTSNQFTMGKYVKEFEKKFAEFAGVKYALFVSSGSAANRILAMTLKDKKESTNSKKNEIIFPSTTWTTSVSPFIREGFTPHFIDVNLNDFSFNYDKLEEYIKHNHKKVFALFPTAVLGFSPDITRLKSIANKYDISLLLDNCESMYSRFADKNLCSLLGSTSSTYFGHLLSSIEGGFVCTNDLNEFKYFVLLRNHGLSRSLDFYPEIFKDGGAALKNPLTDPKFTFSILGDNLRNTEFNALVGLINLEKAPKNIKHRLYLYDIFYRDLDKNKYILPSGLDNARKGITNVPFCFPIISRKDNLDDIKFALDTCGWESRPFISGNLLRHTPYQIYGDYHTFTNSEILNNQACYCGLHQGISPFDVVGLVNLLNNI